MDKTLFDINDVCRLLNTTSRTLRFYEEKGIIGSTKIPFNLRRHYSREQIDHIRNVMVLRQLGLPVKSISELQRSNRDIKEAILERRAEIYALLETKNRELYILTEAIERIEAGKDIFTEEKPKNSVDSSLCDIVKKCTVLFVEGKINELYEYFIPKMVEYRPVSSFELVREDVLKPIGGFLSYGKIEVDKNYKNIYYHSLYYEKMGLEIKYVFINEKIGGFWLNYYELE